MLSFFDLLARAAAGAALFVISGCSSTAGGGTGGAGGHGTTGTSSGTTSTTSPVPATPDAAWVVNLTSGGGACALANSTVKVGDVDAATIQLRVDDGQMVMGQTASVACAVSPKAGGGFVVQGQVSLGGDLLGITIPAITKSATMASPATGSVTYQSTKTVTTYSGSSCNFYFVNANEGVDSGKFWSAFDCAEVTSSSSPPSTCPIAQSFVAFENCTTTSMM